jgi:hypothetical protein
MSKHRNELFADPNFERALDYSILNSLPTIFIDNRRVCLCCGSGFSKPNKEGYYNNDDKLTRERDQAVERHFKNNSEHAASNQKQYAELKKQLVEYKATTSPLPVGNSAELTKIRRELNETKRKLENMTERLQEAKDEIKEVEREKTARESAYFELMECYNKHFKIPNDVRNEIRSGLRNWLFELFTEKYMNDPDNDKELDETEEGCKILEIRDGRYLQYFDEAAYNRLKDSEEQEEETPENAYKYGFEKDEDQHSDGIYDGEVDITPWLK